MKKYCFEYKMKIDVRFTYEMNLTSKIISYMKMNDDMFRLHFIGSFVETHMHKSYLGFVSYDICWIIEILFHIRKVSSEPIKFLMK